MRRLVAAAATAALLAHGQGFDAVVPGKALAFPRDFGAHPGYRIEWWYVTGQLDSAHGPLGFQVTFFRVRNPAAEGHGGRFSPAQLLFAHAALTEVGGRRYLHDQRAGRALDSLVQAAQGDTDVRIDDWSLVRRDGAYHARIDADGFALDLDLAPTQPVLVQGDAGYSRKGPDARQASCYYSEPQLRVAGHVRAGQATLEVRGRAWLDHEWSSDLLAPGAAGWDWLGANLDDGGALMAFRIRGKDGSVLWVQGMLRPQGGKPVRFGAGEVAFIVRRRWKSPATGVEYPVAMTLRLGERTWTIDPLLEDQELDARASTGTVYWEGAVQLAAAAGGGGHGYLELTGYGASAPY